MYKYKSEVNKFKEENKLILNQMEEIKKDSIISLASHNREIENSNKENKLLYQSNLELKNKIDQVENENKRILKEFTAELNKKNEHFEKINNNYNNSLYNYQNELNKLNKSNKEKQESIKKMKLLLKSNEAILQSTYQKNNELRLNIQDLIEKLNLSEENSRKSQERIRMEFEDFNDIKLNEFSKRMNANKQLFEENKVLKKEKQNFELEIHNYKIQNDNSKQLKRQLETKNSELNEMILQLEIAREEIIKIREIKQKFELKCKDYVNEIEKLQFNLNEKSTVIEHFKEQLRLYQLGNFSNDKYQIKRAYDQNDNQNCRRLSDYISNKSNQRFHSSSCSTLLNDESIDGPQPFIQKFAKKKTIIVPRKTENYFKESHLNFKSITAGSELS